MANDPALSRVALYGGCWINDMALQGPGANIAEQAQSFDETVGRMLPLDRLDRESASLSNQYQEGKPFPYLVMDDFLDPTTYRRVVEDWPQRGARDWSQFDNAKEIKDVSRGIADLPPFIQSLFLQLSSEPFIARLRAITGMQDLVWDPMFHGAGLHETPNGGWLNVHTDFLGHAYLPLVRRANLIIYINPDWQEDWGGALGFYDHESEQEVTAVPSLGNRAVLFSTTATSLHGFPKPVSCPPDQTRKILSVYYWSPDRAAMNNVAGIRFLPGNGDTRFKAFARSFVPPIVLRTARDVHRKLASAKK